MDFGGGDEVRFERAGKAGIITLKRPSALNALTQNMALAISRALNDWEEDDRIAVVIIRGEGRAFCAGGDIQAIYRAGRTGSPLYDFFADEYRLNIRIESYSKPYVALIDGIVMGGGVGVSIHGSHRVFTENARFAMPEVTIGFFPDVGGSRFLPRLPGQFGLWLGLTGSRLAWGDSLWSGLATHCVESGDLNAVIDRLSETGDANAVLGTHSQQVPRVIDDAQIDNINLRFDADTIGDLLNGLRSAADRDDEFVTETLAKLGKASPTSLHVAFRQIRAGAMLSMTECMKMEYRIVSRMLEGHDFYEGIRAAVIDKDGAPVWQPGEVGQVDVSQIARYFAPLGSHELSLAAEGNGAPSP
ncbi:MAG: enoyl-CoA hydratase/isomerase family protein [Rhizobiaceae bacterium]